ncbi:MAG: diaminopimelate decarboxylase family protein [Nocardioidaceae bacterium]
MLGEELAGSRGIGSLGISLVRAAREFGTPVYVLDAASVGWAAAQIEAAFPDPWIRQYSLKANDLPAVVSLLAARGWGANVVSVGEWVQARAADVAERSVTFEGIGKTDAELEHTVAATAAGAPLRWLALESPAEVLRLTQVAERTGLGRGDIPPLDVLFRLNPQVQPETLPELAVGASSSKFGMGATEIMSLVRDSVGRPGLRVRGVHVHVGSDLHDVAAWAAAGVRAVHLLKQIASYTDSADTVDFGGGFPLSLTGAPTPASFAAALTHALDDEGLELPTRRAIEPGRYLVGAAGWLVSSVLHARPRAPYPQQTVLDAGMTELIRPALYGSRHTVHALTAESWADEDLRDTAVEGPVCELTDSFGIHPLPALRRGDLIAIEGAGAYAASFTSRYNGRPQPPEVLLYPGGSLRISERAAITGLTGRTRDPHWSARWTAAMLSAG